jgi:hypothetical protein
MTLRELMDRAAAGYPDGDLRDFYDPETGEPRDGVGDTLALFVARELAGTYEPEAGDDEQVATAVDAITTAIEDLEKVRDVLLDLE